MSLPEIVLGMLVLLMSPGPTNTLMALAGAQGGVSRVARLLPAEMVGYAAIVFPLIYAGQEIASRFPSTSVIIKVVAAAWIAILAWRLWRRNDDALTTRNVTAAEVFFTTALNPKALIFGFVLLPPSASGEFDSKIAAFLILVPLLHYFGAH